MIYYHVSLGIDSPVKNFNPRIPDTALGLEDTTIERICFAPTIEQCLSAIHHSEDKISLLYHTGKPVITVYELDVNSTDTGLVPNSIVQKYVHDAYITGEVWYTLPLELEAKYFNLINYTSVDYFYTHEYYREDVEYYVEKWIDEGYHCEQLRESLDSMTLAQFLNCKYHTGVDLINPDLLEDLELPGLGTIITCVELTEYLKC